MRVYGIYTSVFEVMDIKGGYRLKISLGHEKGFASIIGIKKTDFDYVPVKGDTIVVPSAEISINEFEKNGKFYTNMSIITNYIEKVNDRNSKTKEELEKARQARQKAEIAVEQIKSADPVIFETTDDMLKRTPTGPREISQEEIDIIKNSDKSIESNVEGDDVDEGRNNETI